MPVQCCRLRAQVHLEIPRGDGRRFTRGAAAFRTVLFPASLSSGKRYVNVGIIAELQSVSIRGTVGWKGGQVLRGRMFKLAWSYPLAHAVMN